MTVFVVVVVSSLVSSSFYDSSRWLSLSQAVFVVFLLTSTTLVFVDMVCFPIYHPRVVESTTTDGSGTPSSSFYNRPTTATVVAAAPTAANVVC